MNWIENVEVNFEHNDIMLSTAEAIVCPVTLELTEYGKISQGIFKTAHVSFINDLNVIKEELTDGQLMLGQAIAINCKPTYQIGSFKRIVLVALWDNESQYSYNLFYMSYINSLREAIQLDIKTIALPIMAYDGNLDFCCQAIANVLHDLNNLKKSAEFSLETIDFISLNNKDVNFADNYVLSRLYR